MGTGATDGLNLRNAGLPTYDIDGTYGDIDASIPTAVTNVALQRRSYRGSAKLSMRSPPRRPLSPPPDATAMNCSPFTMYTDGEPKTPDPVLNFQSS